MVIDIVYYFSNDNYDIIETKRTDMPENTPKHKMYQWIIINRGVIKKLKFEQMASLNGGDQLRKFNEGLLVFNESIAMFNNNVDNIKLETNSKNNLETKKYNKIKEFILNENIEKLNPNNNLYIDI